MKKLLAVLIICVGLVVFFIQSRTFVDIPNGNHITVWKTLNNKCYVVMGRYYGITKPYKSENYVETTNDAMGASIFWKDLSDSLIIAVGGEYKIHNNTQEKPFFIDYKRDKMRNDSLYTEWNADYKIHLYRKGINKIAIEIENKGAL